MKMLVLLINSGPQTVKEHIDKEQIFSNNKSEYFFLYIYTFNKIKVFQANMKDLPVHRVKQN